MVIMGIDPGLNATGYGIIQASPSILQVLTAGHLRPPRARPLGERLAFLYAELGTLIERYHPQNIVLEMVFTHHNYVATAALMAHARGVACLIAQEHGVALSEYPPARVKKSLTGNGAASKKQVARMVAQWLQHTDASWSADATDALALAIAHAHTGAQRQVLPLSGVIARIR